MLKFLLTSTLLACALTAHAQEQVNTIAVAQKEGVDIELYDVRGGCLPGERRGGKFPTGDRYHYTMACWHIEGDNAIVRFDDGTLEVLKRHQMTPVMRSGPML